MKVKMPDSQAATPKKLAKQGDVPPRFVRVLILIEGLR
jgi:hypothetical protein